MHSFHGFRARNHKIQDKKNAEVISLLSLLAMTGILTKAFTLGNFSSEDSKLLAKPWGIVSLMSL